MPPQIDARALQGVLNKIRQELCKGNAVFLEPKADGTVDATCIRVEGCKNERRNGSAWCQKCSDEHKSKQNEQA